ncbi:MAG: glycoside hydrolase family 127 protein [Clostridia bacterium]|nr:glycoside hydrolase family 127 protein [Clostridia bacterium]
MRNLYKEKSVNSYRMSTDKLFVDTENRYSYNGIIDKTYKFIEEFQLKSPTLWRRFVQQFRESSDNDGGWRGEYWGKMMRGATFVYSYTRDGELYSMLSQTVEDMIESVDSLGRISSYPADNEFRGWDMWCRKYVLLGMQYFLEICRDESLEKRVIASMCTQVDYIASKIGDGEGQTKITHTSNFWRGLNASSILEPVVRLYMLTENKTYLSLAEHIIRHGCIDIGNVFEYALADGLYPYQYPVTKAYEMISCFEGLLEYYRLTGDEKHKRAVVNFADKMLETDFTVIGSGGCTHELFDHSTVRQANTTNGNIAQETCVTVTMMKFMYQVHLVTGDPKYVDAFERSLYNAYLGAVNTNKKVCYEVLTPECVKEPMPFDSYSPLTADRRGKGVGGLRFMSDNHYYGCCACIGSAGIGLVSKMQLMTTPDGIALNLFVDGKAETLTPSGEKLILETATDYPKGSDVSVKLTLDKPERFTLFVRNPEWSKNTSVKVNGQSVQVSDGYVSINREWKSGDTVEISLDMPTVAIYPEVYGEQVLMTGTVLDRGGNLAVIPVYDKQDPLAIKHIALQRGPLMLAQENGLGYSVDDPIDVLVNADGTVDVKESTSPYESIVALEIPLCDGSFMTVTDYSSAGKGWNDESKMAVWMLTK